MGQETLIIFGTFLMLLVVIGIYQTIKEFNDMEEQPEQYSPSIQQEDVQVRE